MEDAGQNDCPNPTAAAGLDEFRTLVEARLGLRFEDSGRLAESLRTRIEARKLDLRRYLHLLESPLEFKEWRTLAQQLTVTETSFFRHEAQFRAFARAVLPACLQRHEGRNLHILSAGCASGEEAYTLAMLIDAADLDPACQVSITGVDINHAALNKAAAGYYEAAALGETPPEALDRWFRPQAGGYMLDARIRAMVHFEERNLAGDDAALWHVHGYDVVFCRNVLSYFSPALAQDIVRRITRALRPGAYLFLGKTENLQGLSADFDACRSEGGIYYRRHNKLETLSAPCADKRNGMPAPDFQPRPAAGTPFRI